MDEKSKKNNQEKPCDEPACFDTPANFLKDMFKNSTRKIFSKKSSNKTKNPYFPFLAPPTRRQIGRHSWTLLHTMAAHYPDNPTEIQQQKMRVLLENLAIFYPCPTCSQHVLSYIDDHPIKVSSRYELSLWVCHLHNSINERLGKPIFPCEDMFKRWYKVRSHM